jgi:hypothetical protein
MNPLASLYGLESPMKMGRRKYETPKPSWDGRMVGLVAIAALCAGGVAFYLRFLVALSLERRTLVGMFVRLNTVSGDNPAPEAQLQPSSDARAA